MITTPEGREVKIIFLRQENGDIGIEIEADESCDVRSMTGTQHQWLKDKSLRSKKKEAAN